MKFNETVFVMSEATWEKLKDDFILLAKKEDMEGKNPMKYLINIMKEINISIDNSVPYGDTEKWDKKVYYDYMKEYGDDDEQ